MAKFFRRGKKMPRRIVTDLPSGDGRPTCASVLADVATLEATLSDHLKAQAGKPHSDALASLIRRHELVRTARLFLAQAEHGGTLLGLLMDFREFALKSVD